MSAPLLTSLRHAVWRAIDESPELAGTFRRTWRFDDASPVDSMPMPAPGELPALAIYPSGSSRSEWVLSQSQRLDYVLEITLWTAHGSLLAGERIWEEIARAILGSRVPQDAAESFSLAGMEMGPLAAKITTLGKSGPRVTCWQWSISIPITWNPVAS